MKHSSAWFALILISSAFVLSAASLSPSPSQIPSPGIETESHHDNPSGKPIALSDDRAHVVKPSDKGTAAIYNYYCEAPQQGGLSTFATIINIVLTFFLMLFTAGLVYVGKKQAEWMGKQAEWMGKTNTIYEAQKELLRQQTILAHRPRIRVRDFNLLQKLEVNGPIEISCDIANIGGTQATFISSNITVRIGGSDSVPWKLFTRLPHPYDGELHYVEDWLKEKASPEHAAPTLDSGVTLPITKTRRLPLQPDELEDFKTGKFAIYVLGFFFYRDGANQHHRTAFCRKMLFGDLRFHPIDDPDLEYED